jgi:hypothetical protein
LLQRIEENCGRNGRGTVLAWWVKGEVRLS